MTSVAAIEALAGRPVLVTGASGFIGSHLVRRLIAAGADVHVLLRPGQTAARLADVRAALIVWEGDVEDYSSLVRCCRGASPQSVVHLAADTSVRRLDTEWTALERSVAVNLIGTLNLLRAAQTHAPVETFVRAGGLEEYGMAPTPFDEEARELPSSPYSASQVAATHYGQMLQQHVAFGVVTLRPALVYGPGQSSDFLIPSLIASCLRQEPFAMTAGEQHRELLYVDDVVDAFCLAAARTDLRGEVINVGCGVESRIREIAETIMELAGTPGLVRFGTTPDRPGDLMHLVGATARATSLLGWRPRVTLREGLARTIAWYRDRPGRT